MGLIGRYVKKILLDLSLAVQRQAGVLIEKLKRVEESELKVTDAQTGTGIPPGNPQSQTAGPPRHWIELVRLHAPELLQPAQSYKKGAVSSQVVHFVSATQNSSESAANGLTAEKRAYDGSRLESNWNLPDSSDVNKFPAASNDIDHSITKAPPRHDTKVRHPHRNVLSTEPATPKKNVAALQHNGPEARISAAAGETKAGTTVDDGSAPAVAEAQKTRRLPLFSRMLAKNRDNPAFRQTTFQNSEPSLMKSRITVRPQWVAGTHSIAGQESTVPLPLKKRGSGTTRNNPSAGIRNHTENNDPSMAVKKLRDSFASESSSQKEGDPGRNPGRQANPFSNDNIPAAVFKHGNFSSTIHHLINPSETSETFETSEQEDVEHSIKRLSPAEFSDMGSNADQRRNRLSEHSWPNIFENNDVIYIRSPETTEPWPSLPENPVTSPKLSLHCERPGRFEDDWREMDRLRRINAEQKGVTWNG